MQLETRVSEEATSVAEKRSGADVGIALLHGGFHGSWCWGRVLPLLEAPSVAVDLPGRSGDPADLDGITAADWARSAAEQIDALGTSRVVLVGHSLGGVTTLNAAKLLGERVAHLVFVSALVPAEGQEPADLIAEGAHRDALFDETGAFALPPYEACQFLLANDLEEEESRRGYDLMRNEPAGPITEPFTHEGVPDVPLTYIRLARDNAVPWDKQERMISNLGRPTTTHEIDAGHSVMLSRPDELARVLNQIVLDAAAPAPEPDASRANTTEVFR
jgi:pimeloyl-ACP methyl ester carboxylesterase